MEGAANEKEAEETGEKMRDQILRAMSVAKKGPNTHLSEEDIRGAEARQKEQHVLDLRMRIQRLEDEAKQANKKMERILLRERRALFLLQALVKGVQSTDLDVPGYEDALAFFVQEKMLNPNREVDVTWPEEAEKTKA